MNRSYKIMGAGRVWNKETTVLKFVSTANRLIVVLGTTGKPGEEPALVGEILSLFWAVVALRIQQSCLREVT